ncbi:threonine synthase [Galbibacter pacificus]|uniref:Threonine synthase n=1 Tax=Galbibacter pacificus TaxID=2996052 RepID=A0ABT6FUC4_9FLAO|nr:threonine synthase [Galbibacter pacificus]MDG3583667.1 threonine synthase [Galbibacter pacificus]MDG3586857.1 threonine synthase [Galbibacter pacificus]
MKYYSLNDTKNNSVTSFEEAVVKGIAPDRGLYFPNEIKPLDKDFIDNIEQYSNEEIAFKVIHQFVNGEIPDGELKKIVKETLCFDFPTVKIEDNVYSLELFHGPTMAFKDIGARFMARCLGYFNRNKKNETVTVLVATSGDTGGAVASGFLGVKGVEVVILYPSGKVSDIQEKQLTTLGQNITALEVDGVFDDCQDMVKTAFLDPDLTAENLTSANSINVARWLPQMFYFFFAYKQLKSKHQELVFSVPSGNFGNICAGIMAHKLGLPVKHFVASTNINDTVPQYMATQKYSPKASQQTISNAMDVGNPSNFIRIQTLLDNNFEKLGELFSSYSFTDEATKKTMQAIYKTSQYVADPHGAVGYMGLKQYLNEDKNTLGIFLETAHPVKFLDVVEETLDVTVPIPEQIKTVIDRKKVSHSVKNYEALKSFLKNREQLK